MASMRGRSKNGMKVIFTHGKDGWWSAETPQLPGAYGQGRTRTAALRNLESAVRDLLETYWLQGRVQVAG